MVQNKRGFTLVEVMLSVTIITLIMGTILFSYSEFNGNLAVSAAAQELVINVRRAQTYGLAVKEVRPGGGKFDVAYGIYVETAPDPTQYYLFADENNNQKYDVGNGCGSGSTECIEKITLRDGVKVDIFCDGSTCPPFGNNNITSLNVSYIRPNPDGVINFTDSSGFILSNTSIAQVVFISPNGKNVTVTIQSAGQISIQ